MNRFVAQLFASLIGALHFAVLVFLAVALAGVVLNLDQAQPIAELIAAGPPQLSPDLMAALQVFGVALGYILVMGVLSTLIAINQNLERIAQDTAPRLAAVEADG